ncbi:cation:proton antiporter [Zunongwangia sp. F363]|uniref:Cation:proton antiporter n=1 Tax=Autumnicola tepida TaxID=3075595 RepID=A0ABU3C627_9FLAO|nr:cation:proton antiporter [Zunongwangia sp. F363]MDT0641798.1 cation:proton antiporter [Zunongwangia sp. F363]
MDLMLSVFFVSLLILASGGLFKWMEDVFLTGPLLAMLLGILLGPMVLDIIQFKDELHAEGTMKIACEFTIAMALMATALRIPDNFFRKHLWSQSVIICLGMVFMCLLSTTIFYVLLDGFSFTQCLLFGAIITPTDPVIAATLITGEKAKKYLPSMVRRTLSFEAGANDGLAYPIVLFSIFLVNNGWNNFPTAKFLQDTILYETILCSVIAYITGRVAGFLMHKAHEHNIMNRKSVLPFSLALAFMLLSGLDALSMNGIIGVFVGGLGYARYLNKQEDLQEERVQESMERIFTIPVFFFLGIALPWQEWLNLGWTAVLICVGILLFRRIPALLLLMPIIPKFRKKLNEVLVMGWFGPIGVAALYYALHAKENTSVEEVWIIPTLMVFASTIIHGVTSLPFERLSYRLRKSDKEN